MQAEPPPFDVPPYAPLAGVSTIVIKRSDREVDFTAEADASPHTPPRLIFWASVAVAAFYAALVAAGAFA